MPMVPLCMSSRQPHPTRYKATPPSTAQCNTTKLRCPSIKPSIHACNLAINRLPFVPNTHPAQQTPASLRGSKRVGCHLPPARGVTNSSKSVIRKGSTMSTKKHRPASAHTLEVGASIHPMQGPLYQRGGRETHKPMVLPWVMVL